MIKKSKRAAQVIELDRLDHRLILASDIKGILYHEILPKKKTMNAVAR